MRDAFLSRPLVLLRKTGQPVVRHPPAPAPCTSFRSGRSSAGGPPAARLRQLSPMPPLLTRPTTAATHSYRCSCWPAQCREMPCPPVPSPGTLRLSGRWVVDRDLAAWVHTSPAPLPPLAGLTQMSAFILEGGALASPPVHCARNPCRDRRHRLGRRRQDRFRGGVTSKIHLAVEQDQ